MSLVKETQALRKLLAELAAGIEWEYLHRYDLLREKIPPKFWDRWFLIVWDVLAKTGLVRPHVTRYSWQSALKHAPSTEGSTTFLIWALGIQQEELRAACDGFVMRFDSGSDIVPVLVTDVADFYYYSRLNWLVEYVPDLSGAGESYSERKQRYLAWRYQDAVVVPVSAGLASAKEWKAMMEGGR